MLPTYGRQGILVHDAGARPRLRSTSGGFRADGKKDGNSGDDEESAGEQLPLLLRGSFHVSQVRTAASGSLAATTAPARELELRPGWFRFFCAGVDSESDDVDKFRPMDGSPMQQQPHACDCFVVTVATSQAGVGFLLPVDW